MSQTNRGNSPAILYFEDVLPSIGWGLYYKFMIGMACACSFSQATALLSLAYAVPMSGCESLMSRDIAFGIYICFVFGRAIGGLIMNTLCDFYGRKRFISYSLLFIFIATFTAAFGYNYYVIMIAALFLGAGYESNAVAVKVHAAEILPKNTRGFYLAFCDAFWTLGYLLLSLFAIYMKNSMMYNKSADMRLSTWRMVFTISGGLNIMTACASALLEESARWFLYMKKNYLAVLILKQFYAINKSSYGESFSVKEADLANLVFDYNITSFRNSNSHIDNITGVLRMVRNTFSLAFSKPFLRDILILLTIKSFMLILGILEINILLSKYLSNYPVADGIDVIYLEAGKKETVCMNTENDKVLYGNYFVIAVNILIGQMIVMLVVDKLGRKITLVASLLLNGCFYISLYFVKNSTVKMIVSSVIMMALSAAVSTVSIVNIEVFPTALRGTSHGITNLLGLILSSLVVRFFYIFERFFIIVIGSFYLGATLAACFIQDLKRLPMIE